MIPEMRRWNLLVDDHGAFICQFWVQKISFLIWSFKREASQEWDVPIEEFWKQKNGITIFNCISNALVWKHNHLPTPIPCEPFPEQSDIVERRAWLNLSVSLKHRLPIETQTFSGDLD